MAWNGWKFGEPGGFARRERREMREETGESCLGGANAVWAIDASGLLDQMDVARDALRHRRQHTDDCVEEEHVEHAHL